MKITPLEIRQKTFDRTLRGYDKDEVNAFLLKLSQEWEKNRDEMKDLRLRLESSEKEVARLRETETALYETVKTVESTGVNTIEQAKKAAELLLREAQITGDSITNESRMKAKNTIEVAEVNARQILVDAEENFKNLVQHYKILESHRNNLIADLKRLANEMLERAERATTDSNNFKAEDLYSNQVRNSSDSSKPEDKSNYDSSKNKPTPPPSPNTQGSFFDNVLWSEK